MNANKLIWAAFLIGIAVLAYAFRGTIYEKGGTLTATPHPSRQDTVVLRWEGRVGPPMHTLIADAFREWKGTKQRFILSLSSGGGLLTYGGEVIDMLNRIKRTHRLDTVVDSNSHCLSMCVPIYLQGQTRYAAPGSKWMFHEVSAVDVVEDRGVAIDPRVVAAETRRFINDYLRPAGVSSRWLDGLYRKMRGRDYWLTGQQLFDQGAGVIQKLI